MTLTSLLTSSFALAAGAVAAPARGGGTISATPPSFFNCSLQPAHAFEPVTLRNGKGIEARMIAYGATMTHFLVPDAGGVQRDVLLGWDDATQYCANAQHTYFGATIGRVANRITKCSFELEGQGYNVDCNERDWDTLHGGVVGFDRRVWTAFARSSSSVKWSYFSPDGEMGFPGDLSVNVTHTITEDNEWLIEYSAAVGVKATVVSMTNHAYFNLNANVDNTETVMEHVLHMPSASRVLEVSGAPDYHLIPTGKVLDIAPGSAMDFAQPKVLGQDIAQGTVSEKGGYDNAWIFGPSPMTSKMTAHRVTLTSPLTGIQLEMGTDQPSVQVYTANSLSGMDHLQRKASQSFGSEPQYYHYRGAITLEAQQYPDAVHHENFPSTVLKPGGLYEQRTSYKFSTADRQVWV